MKFIPFPSLELYTVLKLQVVWNSELVRMFPTPWIRLCTSGPIKQSLYQYRVGVICRKHAANWRFSLSFSLVIWHIGPVHKFYKS